MKRKRAALGIAVVILVVAIPFVIAMIMPVERLPGARLRRSNGAQSIHIFDETKTAESMAKALETDGWIRNLEDPGTMNLPPDSVRDWILTFKKGTDRLTVYGMATIQEEGRNDEQGAVGVIWRKAPLPEVFYELKSYFSPELTLQVTAGGPPP